MFIRGKYVQVMAPADDELSSSAGGGSAGEGGLDLSVAGDSISADLFGTSGDDDNGGNADDVSLDDNGGTDTPPAAGASPAAGAPSATEGEGTAPPAASTLQPPKTWRPEAAAKFATLPPEVQQEVLKREEDIFKGLESYKADASIGKALKGIIQPYMQVFQAQGIDPMQQVSGLMRAHVALATGTPEQKQQFFRHLAKEYGVDLDVEAPYVDPQVAGLQKQLSDLQSRLNGREQHEANEARSKLQAEIDSFASDPAHQYFDEVANDIAGLLRSGAAKDLKGAYDKAIWANPITRAKEQARLTADADAKAKAEAAERAKQARKATGANVKSSAKAASGTAPLGSIDDTLNAALVAIKSRA